MEHWIRCCIHPDSVSPACVAAWLRACVAAVQWAALEGGARSLAFTSGMAALAVATKLVPAGGHIVAGDDLYGGTSRLLSRVVPNNGITVSNVDMTDLK